MTLKYFLLNPLSHNSSDIIRWHSNTLEIPTSSLAWLEGTGFLIIIMLANWFKSNFSRVLIIWQTIIESYKKRIDFKLMTYVTYRLIGQIIHGTYSCPNRLLLLLALRPQLSPLGYKQQSPINRKINSPLFVV